MGGLYIVGLILLIVWIVALVTHFVVSAAIHLLLAAAIIMFVVGLVAGRRTVAR